jgi:hypothetical protein
MPKFNLLREPALLLTFVATAIRLISAFFFELSGDQQAWLNAAATAILSAVVAIWVSKEGQVPAILGAIQAVLALAVGLGLHWSAEQQAVFMSFVGTIAAFYTRTQVVAPSPASTVIKGELA